MSKRPSLSHIGIPKRDFLAVFILVLNAFAWLYMTGTTLRGILNELSPTETENTIIWVTYYAAIIGSSVVGAFFSPRIGKARFIVLWMSLGAVFSLIPIFFEVNTIARVLILGFVWAVTFGIGMPSCLSFFTEHTVVESRGRSGGTTYLAINISMFIFALSFQGLETKPLAVISAVWRGLGLLIFFTTKPKEKKNTEARKQTKYSSVVRNRSFTLYFIPWLMFCLINRLERPVLESLFGADFYGLMIIMEFVVGSLFALIGGFLSDLVGRKRVVVYGFIALGLAYALLGLAPSALVSWYSYALIDGAAWGIFAVIFLMVLWGDLSQDAASEKYYAIGGIPFILADMVQLILNPYVKTIPSYAAFSFASLFLFLAVLPLMYAPETLPKKKIELRQLRAYIEQAKKAREKYLGKGETKG